jgi:polysaccharide export outer membrane protein
MRTLIAFTALLWAASAAEIVRGVLGPDDSVTIMALNVDEISKQWRIGPSGELNLPMVGRFKAAGMTADQLETEIANRLKQFVHDPQVTVFVSDFKSHPVTVSGAVDKPGTLQLEKPTPLFAVIAQAGGIKDAGPTVTLTRRVENGPIPASGARESKDGQFSILELPIQSVLRGNGDAANVEVRPFDTVTVSQEKRARMVFLSGEVNRPGGIELTTQETVSLSKALAMAGGVTHSAKPSRTVIRHINSKGQETAFAFVDLKRVLSGKAKDLTLTDGDVVVVPSSSIQTYLQTMSTTAITSGVMILGRL